MKHWRECSTQPDTLFYTKRYPCISPAEISNPVSTSNANTGLVCPVFAGATAGSHRVRWPHVKRPFALRLQHDTHRTIYSKTTLTSTTTINYQRYLWISLSHGFVCMSAMPCVWTVGNSPLITFGGGSTGAPEVIMPRDFRGSFHQRGVIFHGRLEKCLFVNIILKNKVIRHRWHKWC